MTVGEALRDAETRLRAHDIEDGRLEAEVLLAHALGVSREGLLRALRDPITPQAQENARSLVDRRIAHEPAAYIVGHREFFGLDLECSPAALIPRPETELLVEAALGWLAEREPGTGKKELRRPTPPRLVADVGTGNGAIAVAIAAHAPNARIVATDTSRAALELARRNARRHGVEGRTDFVQAWLLAAARAAFDAIVSNLPYVPTRLYEELPPEIRAHEPESALHAGESGTELIEALVREAAGALRPGGLLLAEHGWDQGERLREVARASLPGARVETRRDLAGEERLLVIEASTGGGHPPAR